MRISQAKGLRNPECGCNFEPFGYILDDLIRGVDKNNILYYLYITWLFTKAVGIMFVTSGLVFDIDRDTGETIKRHLGGVYEIYH